MPGNFKREDLRIVKTRKALLGALSTQLRQRGFSKLTVFDICAEALVSRTAFYAHFSDKYDLLGCWLQDLRDKCVKQLREGDESDQFLYDLFRKHLPLIVNLLENADQELTELLFRFLAPAFGLPEKREGYKMDPSYAVLSRFLMGGLLHTLLWRAKNTRNVPENEVKATLVYLRGLIKAVAVWETGRPLKLS